MDGRGAVGVDRTGRTGPRVVHGYWRGSVVNGGRLSGHGREFCRAAGRDPAAGDWRGGDRQARG